MLFRGKTSESLDTLPLFTAEPYNWTADTTAVSISATVAGNFFAPRTTEVVALAVAL